MFKLVLIFLNNFDSQILLHCIEIILNHAKLIVYISLYIRMFVFVGLPFWGVPSVLLLELLIDEIHKSSYTYTSIKNKCNLVKIVPNVVNLNICCLSWKSYRVQGSYYLVVCVVLWVCLIWYWYCYSWCVCSFFL